MLYRKFTMNNEVYLLMRKAGIPELKEECMGRLLQISGLDYRVIRSLINIIANEGRVSRIDIEKLLDPGFYTRKNLVMAAKDGFYDIVPIKYFEDEEWLKETHTYFLPTDFAKSFRQLKAFIIRPQIRHIGGYAFAKCQNLEHVLIAGNNLLDIGDYAFRDCKNLKIDTLPDGIDYIGKGCFKGCESIENLKLPAGVKDIQQQTFKNCINMKYIYTAEHVRVGEESFENCESLTGISGTVTGIEKGSFKNCPELTEIKLSVDGIPKHAFYGCRSLESIYFIDKTPHHMHEDAMDGCSSLAKVDSSGFAYQMRSMDGYFKLAKCSLDTPRFDRRTGMVSQEDIQKCKFLYKKNVHNIFEKYLDD